MSSSERFQPHASRAMASMFDDVSGRYDLLNRVMTLGQDGAWREAMWDVRARRRARGARPVHRQRRLAARPAPARTARSRRGREFRDARGGARQLRRAGLGAARGVRRRVPLAASRRLGRCGDGGVRRAQPAAAAGRDERDRARAAARRRAGGARGRRARTRAAARRARVLGAHRDPARRPAVAGPVGLPLPQRVDLRVRRRPGVRARPRDGRAGGRRPALASCSGRRGCGWPVAARELVKIPPSCAKPCRMQAGREGAGPETRTPAAPRLRGLPPGVPRRWPSR